MNLRNARSAFTLIEATLALGVLTFGLTAVVAVYMISLTWIEEIRVDMTALQTGRIVLASADVLTDKDNDPAGYNNLDTVAKGWVNDYFVVRTVEEPSYPNFDKTVGTYLRVRIQVYYGGTEEDGLLAHDFYCDQIMPPEYK